MNITEYRATFSLGLLYAVRLLGLFIILPVFTPYASGLIGSSPVLIGVGLGIYGLSQACLQIPLGLLSDRVGRKIVIAGGLLVFAFGSAIAAVSNTITGVIIGRLFQGAGAVGSAISTLLADLTREEHRSKAMAFIGIGVALSFFAAMLLGPVLEAEYGVKGIFWITAGLGIAAIVILLIVVPNVKHMTFHSDTETIPKQLKAIIDHSELFLLDIGVFICHAILICTFIALPELLLKATHLSADKQWILYLPVLISSFIATLPLVILSEKNRLLKQGLLFAIGLLGLSQLMLLELYSSVWGVGVSLFIFFTAFSFLEAVLPSLVSKIAPAGLKGTAMGVFGSAQFLGFFFGGAMGGWFLKHHEMKGLFLFAVILAIIWLMIAANMKQPRYVATHILHIGPRSEPELKRLKFQLSELPGVVDVALIPGDESAYLKIDKSVFNPTSLNIIGV